jgi:Rrf2 family protein
LVSITPVELSCKSEYALLALLELATHYHQGEPLQIRQIAALQNIPDRYLEQLLATLRRGGIIRSQRGAKGGYVLVREPREITVLDVVIALEGLNSQPGDKSASAKSTQSVEGSVIAEIWHLADCAANTVLKQHTLQDLCDRRDARKQLDFMYYI